MSEREKIVMSFIAEMLDASPDDYACDECGKAVVLNFLRMAFKLIEARRPLLIEMKGGAA